MKYTTWEVFVSNILKIIPFWKFCMMFIFEKCFHYKVEPLQGNKRKKAEPTKFMVMLELFLAIMEGTFCFVTAINFFAKLFWVQLVV